MTKNRRKYGKEARFTFIVRTVLSLALAAVLSCSVAGMAYAHEDEDHHRLLGIPWLGMGTVVQVATAIDSHLFQQIYHQLHPGTHSLPPGYKGPDPHPGSHTTSQRPESQSLSGLSAGSDRKNGLGVWLMPLYQNDRVWGRKAGDYKTGYNSDLGGLILGVDYAFTEALTVGVAMNLGTGNSRSTGDLSQTDTSFNFWGVNLYGGWKWNDLRLTADVGYNGNYSKMEATDNLKADVNGHVITAGLRAEYRIETPVLDIFPHVSARYAGINTYGYDMKRDGAVVSNVEQSHLSLWTFPVGILFSKDIETGKAWIFRPKLDLSLIPATGDVMAKSKSRTPGATTVEMKSQVADYTTWQGGVGFDFLGDNLSLGVNYILQASSHRTGHGVFGTIRYEF